MTEALYNPSKPEIRRRCEAQMWMQIMEWPERVLDQVMVEDSPDEQTLRRIVYKHGPKKALEIIEFMNND